MPIRFTGDERTPMYAVGDRVLITNPIDIFDVEDTKVYTITHVKYMYTYAAFAYRLDNGSKWINESWLEPDLFGPQVLDEEAESEMSENNERKALLLEQDYELVCLYDAIQTQDDVSIERSKARLSEIHHELEAIK